MTTIEVRGADLAVTTQGDPDDPTLVWLHGLTSSVAHEDRTGLFAFDLLDGVRVVRYDARGHGGTGGEIDDRSCRWDRLALDLLGLLDALAIGHAVVGGASMGCATSLHATLLAPERVDALVLVIPPTAWGTRAAQSELYRAGADLVEASGTGALADLIRTRPPGPVFGHRSAELLEASATAVEDADPVRLVHAMRGAADSDLPPADALAAIRCPTLILAWEGDPGHPVSTAEVLAEAIPGSALQIARRLEDIEAWVPMIGELVRSVRGHPHG